jgi:AcrR family transcriptional regulator
MERNRSVVLQWRHMAKGRSASRRAPAGAATLQPDVSLAIGRAAMRELARSGYRGMSMEAVARRARVGKAALYRRWPAKRAMVAALLAEWGDEAAAIADTGSLAGDLERFLGSTLDWFADPQTSRILPDLVAEAQRDAALRAALAGLERRRRAAGETVLRRAIARGELAPDADVDLLLELMAAPLFWRAIVVRGEDTRRYRRTLAAALLRAFNARPPATAGS